MQLAKDPCRLELLWRHLGVWAAPALLSQALPRAGASLARGGICVLCTAQVLEPSFNRLSFPGEEEASGLQNLKSSSKTCCSLSSLLLSCPFAQWSLENSKINRRINFCSEFNTSHNFLSRSSCKGRKLRWSPWGLDASHFSWMFLLLHRLLCSRWSQRQQDQSCYFCFFPSVFGHARAKLCHVWPLRNHEPQHCGLGWRSWLMENLR